MREEAQQRLVQANERANQHYLEMRRIERLILNHEFGDVDLPNIAELIQQVAAMRVQQQRLDDRVEQLRDPEAYAMFERARMAGIRSTWEGGRQAEGHLAVEGQPAVEE